MKFSVKKLLLLLWPVLFTLCGFNGVAIEGKWSFLSPGLAQALGILYFGVLYGLLFLSWREKDRKLAGSLMWYGLCAILLYIALLLSWAGTLWKSALGYRVSIVIFSFFTAPLSCFSRMWVCFALWAGLLVVGFMVRHRLKRDEKKA